MAKATPSSSKSTAPSDSGRSAAFFDLDKTLMAGSSGMVFARVANRHGIVPRGQLAKWGFDHLRYRVRGATDEQTNSVLEVARQTFADVPERDIQRLGPEVLAGILPRVYPQMLEEVHRHHDEGRATFIVSAAGNDVVVALARVLGMDGGIGTRWQIGPDGAYTGEIEGDFVYGEGKVTAMKAYAAEHDIDLDASYSYSDSASDLPMLRAVGHAVVVNPDAALLEVAKAEGWRVMRFEKLGRRMAIAAATVLAAGLGAGASIASSRRGRRSVKLPRR